MGNPINKLFEKIISVGFFTKFSVENIGSISLVNIYHFFLTSIFKTSQKPANTSSSD